MINNDVLHLEDITIHEEEDEYTANILSIPANGNTSSEPKIIINNTHKDILVIVPFLGVTHLNQRRPRSSGTIDWRPITSFFTPLNLKNKKML